MLICSIRYKEAPLSQCHRCFHKKDFESPLLQSHRCFNMIERHSRFIAAPSVVFSQNIRPARLYPFLQLSGCSRYRRRHHHHPLTRLLPSHPSKTMSFRFSCPSSWASHSHHHHRPYPCSSLFPWSFSSYSSYRPSSILSVQSQKTLKNPWDRVSQQKMVLPRLVVQLVGIPETREHR